MKPKKHHFVPECYLNHFMPGGSLYVLDLAKMRAGYRKEIKKVKPAQICYIEDYYTIKKEVSSDTFKLTNYDELHIEQHIFSVMENRYAGIVKAFTDSDILPLDDSGHLVDFIVQLKLRNPYWKKHTIEPKNAQWVEAAMQGIQQRETREGRFQHLPQEVKEKVLTAFKANIDNNPNFATEIQQYSLIQRGGLNNQSNKDVREAILRCGWQLFEAPDGGPYFITTDNPGISVGRDNLNYNSKFRDGFYFFFTLSPKLCLVITDADEEVFDYKHGVKVAIKNKIEAEKVILVNNKMIQVANNLLIASDDWYISQIHDINKPAQ